MQHSTRDSHISRPKYMRRSRIEPPSELSDRFDKSRGRGNPPILAVNKFDYCDSRGSEENADQGHGVPKEGVGNWLNCFRR